MTEKLLSHPPALLNTVKRIALEAGDLLLDYYDPAGASDVTYKSDGSPVTKADHAVEEFITQSLKTLFPNLLVVGEEGAAQGASFGSGDFNAPYWLIDPLDGTRAFVAGEPDFAINIALIENHQPIMGIVYAPAADEFYAAHQNLGAVRVSLKDGSEKPLRVRPLPKAGATVTISARRRYGQDFQDYLDRLKVEKQIKRSSALKICMVAAGKADLYPCFGDTSAWDTAAGQIILESAGGFLCDHAGAPLRYGLNPADWRNPYFIAAADTIFLEALSS